MMSEALVAQIGIVVFCNWGVYGTARHAATVDPLTWPDVFAAAFAMALFAWPLTFTTGRFALLTFVVFVLAVVFGATHGAAALAREQRAREGMK